MGTEVAEKLGVSEQTVGRVCKNFQVEIITHDRVKAREYYEDNPDASYREVARQVDASNKTVTEWLKEDFDEGGDDGDLIRPETDTEVAEKLGVSRRLVSDVCSNGIGSIITHDRVTASSRPGVFGSTRLYSVEPRCDTTRDNETTPWTQTVTTTVEDRPALRR